MSHTMGGLEYRHYPDPLECQSPYLTLTHEQREILTITIRNSAIKCIKGHVTASHSLQKRKRTDIAIPIDTI